MGRKVVITTFKNEAPYILEWVAHYRLLGFDDIVVFTNDCTDGTNQILTRLQELGELTFCINKVGPGGIHRSALRQAKRLEQVQQAEWVFVCDIDEFLNIHVGNHRIDDLIEATGDDVDAISIPWKIFSSNGRSVLRNNLVTEQFTDAELPPVEGGATRRFVKTLFKSNDKFKRVGLHGPVLRDEFKSDLVWAVPGGVRKSNQSMGGHVGAPFGYDYAQLNHYAVRSVESYLLKRHRGRANHMSDILDTEYWDRWNRGGEEDTSIHRYLPELRERMALYLSDSVLQQHHRKGFRWHKDLVANLKQEPDFAALKAKCEKRLTLAAPGKERPRLPLRQATPLSEHLEQSSRSSLPHIGSLWIGSDLSYVEQMCLQSFVRQGHPVTLFTYGPVANVPQDVMIADAREIHDPTEFLYSKFGTPVVQSDVFRLKMIRQTGMIWADADMFCLRPIIPEAGHVHGYFSRNSACNALLGLPADSEALGAYIEYVSDPYPIPPWLPEAERKEAERLKKKGEWKHASEQAHDVYGPPALTWFLNQSGEIRHTKQCDAYYPVAFRDLDDLILPGAKRLADFGEDTRAVHLWARRLRWRLPQLGLEKNSFVHDALSLLEINPEIAPLAKEQKQDIYAPARVLPRSATLDEILATTDIEFTNRDIRWIGGPSVDACIRLAEHALRQISSNGLYGIHDKPQRGRMRGIDHYGTGGLGAFALANSIMRYAHNHKSLPDLLNPEGATEKLLIWKHFGNIPVPPPADKYVAHDFVPPSLRKLLTVPDRPWVSGKSGLPENGAIEDGTYFLKANHSHGAHRVEYPINDDTRSELAKRVEDSLAKPHGFWASEWWYMHIDRKVFLERHLQPDLSTHDVSDWKFWTIGGRVVLVQVDHDRSSNHVQLIHDRDLNFLPEKLYYKTGDSGVTRPARYADMLAVAEGIGRKLDFARVDLYDTPAGIVLGEVTLCPMGGRQKILSPRLDAMLSEAWNATSLFSASKAAQAA